MHCLTQYTIDMSILVQLDDFSVEGFAALAASYGSDDFAYVVTPNVDHVIRLNDDATFRSLYADATYVLLDSRFLSYLLRLIGGPRTKVCPGSDLTAALFDRVMGPDDIIVLIGSTDQQAAQLREQYGLRQLRHYNPPMGFIKDQAATEVCLQYVESNSPYRFCLIAVGTPQGEMLAQLLKRRARARGLTFCIGASINFITGVERRAPHWMRRTGLEWLFRLALSPRRLGYRYLVRGPRLFKLLSGLRFVLRRRGPSPAFAATRVTGGHKASAVGSANSD
jgi:exopolysaccharide biosynthesis WecB/TagA/CpsF family protein